MLIRLFYALKKSCLGKLLDTCFEDGLFKDNMKQLKDQSLPNIA